ncbi:MAG: hypothetical protein MZV64_18385 [Ignavibacteriales bacterium]|nr:hypothetical protein [Ignavibacteriales bacterium]
MPSPAKSPHLPFGDQRTAPWYGKDIISVKQFSRDRPGIRLRRGPRDARSWSSGSARSTCSRARSWPTIFYEPSTRTSSSFIAAMQRLGGTVITINEVTLLVGGQGREPARHHPDPRMLRRRHRHPPPRARLGGHGGRGRPQAGHQRRGRRRRAPDPGPPRRLHHPRGAGPAWTT